MTSINFKIIKNDNCPFYRAGDKFEFSDNALILPYGRTAACVILVLDITEVLYQLENKSEIEPKPHIFNCSGCRGMITLEHMNNTNTLSPETPDETESKSLDIFIRALHKFQIFESLDEQDIKLFLPLLTLKKFDIGERIIRKGNAGSKLYIILSGKVEVLVDENIRIAVLGKGDVFGEISILIGNPATATIRVIERLTVLWIAGRDFRSFLKRFPALQMNFSRLLARRLAKTNIERLKDYEAGMTGKITEIRTPELLQTLNLNQKTGTLTLMLQKGTAEVIFKEGSMVEVQYDKKEGEEAFFEILKEKSGRFKFLPSLPPGKEYADEIGDFMWLLMEGLRRADESKIEIN